MVMSPRLMRPIDAATPSTFATFTITPNSVPSSGTYSLGGGTFNYNDTPTLSGWTLTSGTTYTAGPFTFTCDTPGHQSEPTFDDSTLLQPYDGTVTSNFTDGVDAYAGTAATGSIEVTNWGSNGTSISGNWTVGDWTGDVTATPAPTGWSCSGSLSAGSVSFTSTSVGSGQSLPSWDTSAVIGDDANLWDGTVGAGSFTDGTDSVAAAAATQNISRNTAGTYPPSAGSWSVGDDSEPVGSGCIPTGWTVTVSQTLIEINNGGTHQLHSILEQSGFYEQSVDISLALMAIPAASVNFVDGT